MVLAGIHWSPGKFAAPEMTHFAILESKHIKHRFVIILAVRDALLAQKWRPLRRITEIVGVVAVSGGGQKIKIVPPTLSRPSNQARYWRLRDNVERRALSYMA